MSIYSMTAFARRSVTTPQGEGVWELRSVNHRYLELHFKLPEKLRSLEPHLREVLREKLKRGKIDVHLYLEKTEPDRAIHISIETAQAVIEANKKIQSLLPNNKPVSPMDILKWPGVIKYNESNFDEITEPLVNGLSQAAEDLKQVRSTEGSRLTEILQEKLQILDELTQDLRKMMPDILTEHQDKLESKLAALSIDLDPERIAQEVVLMAQKTDVAEELDRLSAHAQEVRDILSNGGTCGRRLDFLMQELHREANTLGSKSIATATSQGAVNLKVIIEQMREQVQNIE